MAYRSGCMEIEAGRCHAWSIRSMAPGERTAATIRQTKPSACSAPPKSSPAIRRARHHAILAADRGLCVDEKSQIRRWTAASRSACAGHAQRRTPDYKRHGTTSLFEAIDVATGRVIGKCYIATRPEFLD